jgi:hypothetical protein
MMSMPEIPKEDLHAAAEVSKELGPDYQQAVIDSFVDHIGEAIDQRVDARLEQHGDNRSDTPRGEQPTPKDRIRLAGISMFFGTGITIGGGSGIQASWVPAVIVVAWVAIVAINVAFGRRQG